MITKEYDLIVLGSGPAGEKGASAASLFSDRIALVEKDPHLGGASANTGTLPSKTLRETALALSGFKMRELYGVDLSIRRACTIREFMYHEANVKSHERKRVADTLDRDRVELIRGTGRFLDPHTVEVTRDGAPPLSLRAAKILIATGSAPFRPPGFPFEHHRVHDSDEILSLDCLPETLAVVGAGVIGSEYACTFAALGVKVNLLDGRDTLLPFLDREVSQALEESMRDNLKIWFHWKQRVVQCTADSHDCVRLKCESGLEMLVDGVLVAAGRTSNTAALNLEAAGIAPGPRGLLTVDRFFRTSVPHIYAAGDVIGFPALAATSAEQARVAMLHAFDESIGFEMAPLLPNGIYTIPEVSSVGETEEKLREQGIDFVAGYARYGDQPRGQIKGDRNGFLKLLFRCDDWRLLGVHVIGEDATELLHIGLMAMLSQAGAEIFTKACFNYPTLGDLYKYATFDAIRQARASGVRPPALGASA